MPPSKKKSERPPALPLLAAHPCASNPFPAGLQPCIINPSANLKTRGKDIKLAGKGGHRLGKEVVSAVRAAGRELEKGHPWLLFIIFKLIKIDIIGKL